MLFAVGVISIILGFYGLYLEHARQDWETTDARVLSMRFLEKGRHGPQEDSYQLEVSYSVQGRDVTAQMNSYGHPSFKAGDSISVKIDPDNSEHFVFNQPHPGVGIALMFLVGIIISGASFFGLRARAPRSRKMLRSKASPSRRFG